MLTANASSRRSLVLVTTSDWLQETIEEVHDLQKHSSMILASTDVSTISFSVGSRIDTLTILRCRRGRGGTRGGQLLITGSSEFHSARIDQWQNRHRRGRRLIIGKGVGIWIDSADNDRWSASNLSAKAREKVRRKLDRMRNTEMEGSWWEKWRGYVASILGVAVTGSKLTAGLKASASGMFVNFQVAGLGAFQFGKAGAGMVTLGTAAGPAVLHVVGVAAAVYFIPWEGVLTSLKGILWSIWDWFTSLWDKFTNWVKSTVGGRASRNGVPMAR